MDNSTLIEKINWLNDTLYVIEKDLKKTKLTMEELAFIRSKLFNAYGNISTIKLTLKSIKTNE